MAKRGKYGFGRIYQPKYRDKTTGELRICSKYYIQYYDQNGCQHREPTEAATEREARGILATRLAQVQAGTAPHITEKSMRYGDLRKLLLDDYRAERNKSLQHLANGQETVKGLTKLDEFFQFKEGTDQGMKVSAITRELFDQFITARRAEGVSDATISNSAKALRRMLSLGVEAGKISKRPKIRIPKAPPAKKDYLEKEEFDRVCKIMRKDFYPLLVFLFYQGRRMNETMTIEWPQIDLRTGTYTPDPEKTKTNDSTSAPLNAEVIKVLRKMQRAEGLVFQSISRKAFKKAFRRAMLKLKLGGPRWICWQCHQTADHPAPTNGEVHQCKRCHCPLTWQYVGPSEASLRASAVTFYRQSGMSDREIMQITGHRSLAVYTGYSRTRTLNIKQQMDAAPSLRARILAEIDRDQPRPVLVVK